MNIPSDYTKLPVGAEVKDGTIAKCPKCGKNGACIDCGDVQWFIHYGMKYFKYSEAGSHYAKRTHRNWKCRVVLVDPPNKRKTRSERGK